MPLIDQIHSHRAEILASAKRHGVVNVRVFGSVARGEERADSDIDLLIDLERPVKDAFGFLGFQEEVEQMLGRKVDIVFETGVYHRLKPIILREAQSI